VPRLCELYPGICLTTEERARKNLSQEHGKFSVRSTENPQPRARKNLLGTRKNLSQVHGKFSGARKNFSQEQGKPSVRSMEKSQSGARKNFSQEHGKTSVRSTENPQSGARKNLSQEHGKSQSGARESFVVYKFCSHGLFQNRSYWCACN
jgi:hypothetical protein